MQLKKNGGGVVSFLTNVAMTGYAVSKNGGGFGASAGSFAVVASGFGQFVNQVTLAAVETDTLGQLAVLIAAAGTYIGLDNVDVVPDVSGATVSEVTGNVDGNVLGLVTISPATRMAIAADVWGTADLIELGLTPQNAMRCCFAVLSGLDTAAPLAAAFRNFGNTKTRVSMVFNAAGERTSVINDFS